MAKDSSLLLFLYVLITIANPTTAIGTTSPSPSPSPTATTTSATLSPPDYVGLQQVGNILDALLGSGDFGNWVDILSAMDPSMFPISATLFIPGDDAVPTDRPPLILDPLSFAYHFVPQRLTFSELQLFNASSRLPTLLLNNTILITNNSRSNFTLDDSPLTQPDLFTSDTIAAHGISKVLDYKVYGGGGGDGTSAPPRGMAPRVEGGDVSTPFWPHEEMIDRRASSGVGGRNGELMASLASMLGLGLAVGFKIVIRN